MFCKNCGNQLPDDSLFCQYCGIKLDFPPKTINQPSTKSQDNSSSQTSLSNKPLVSENNTKKDNTPGLKNTYAAPRPIKKRRHIFRNFLILLFLLAFFAYFGAPLASYILLRNNNFELAMKLIPYPQIYDVSFPMYTEYLKAVDLLQNNNYTEAKEIFETLPKNYISTSSFIEECNRLIEINRVIETEDIKIIPDNIELYVGDSQELQIRITPEDATNKDYKLGSLSTSTQLIKLSGNTVTGIASGEATVVVQQNGKLYGRCSITVKDHEPTILHFSDKSISAKVGDTINLTSELTYYPNNVTDKNCQFEISDSQIATLKTNRLVCNKPGTVAVTVTHITTGLTDSCEITITEVELEDFSITNSQQIQLGSKEKLKVRFTPSNVTDKSVTYSSSNNWIASIDGDYIVANNIGKATIYARHSSGKKTSMEIEVTPVPVSKVVFSPSSASILTGDTYNISYSISPSNATNTKLTWSSSNPSIATVNNGKVTAIKAGECTIYATSENGKRASLKLTVKPKPVKQSNGFIKAPANSSAPQLTIEAPKTESVYVYMKDSSTSKNDYTIFVNANTKCTVNVPTGSYKLYYASGTTWYGPEVKFGDKTSFFKSDDTMRFYFQNNEYNHITVTLYLVENGNMDTDPIPESMFPD